MLLHLMHLCLVEKTKPIYPKRGRKQAGGQIYVFCALQKQSHSDILSNRDNLGKAICESVTLSFYRMLRTTN